MSTPQELGPQLDLSALARLDDAIIRAIQERRHLGKLGFWATSITLLGGAVYGLVFGWWRAPEQALYSAIKLPLLLLSVVAASAVINGLLALLLKSGIGVLQGAVSILLAFAVASLLLLGLAPVALLFVLSVPGPGTTTTSPDELYRIAEYVLAFHIAVIACCGVAGNLRLYYLLGRLAPSRRIAGRVMLSWLVVDGFVGSQLSWILRPFLCKPNLPPEFVRARALEGNFFEELGRILGPLSQAIQPFGWVLAAMLASCLLLMLRRLWTNEPEMLTRARRQRGPYRSTVS